LPLKLKIHLTMKVSNKILLGVFLFIVLLLAGVHAALRVRYNAGDIVKLDKFQNPSRQLRYFDNVHHVVVIGFNQCSVFLSDTVYVAATQKMFENIECRVQGDTLYVDAKWNERLRQTTPGYYEATVYLPRGVTIAGRHSYINFWPGALHPSDTLQRVRLEDSGLSIHTSGKNAQAGKMALQAVNSSIVLTQGLFFDSLSVALQGNSWFNDSRATIQQLTLQADSTANIQLTGRNYFSIK